MHNNTAIEAAIPDLKVLKAFPPSGQKHVYLVEYKGYGHVILKIVKDYNERITREIDIVTKNIIINVPEILETNKAKIDGIEYFYIIEEYIRGVSLKETLKVKPLTLSESLILLETLLIIVVALEKIDVVHRDIKPDNIIYGTNKQFYLIDFGIARSLKLESLTLTKMNVGPHSPGYGAPELFQYKKHDINSKADLFSIGVVVYESIFGKGNSAFIDANWKVISNSWTLMQNAKKLTKQLVEEKINKWTTKGILGVLADDMSGEKEEQSEKDEDKPWEKRKRFIPKEDVDGTVDITLANQIYIKNHNIKARTLNRFRRLAAFSNPEFYKNQAMGFSTNGVPRIIQCGSDTDDYVCLPRGLKDKLISLLDESGITYKVNDKKQMGHAINVRFNGNLYPEQERAAKRMLQDDYGILGAATGFGKTVIGTYLISHRKVNAIVLVHNREIMKNWIDDFEKFLCVNEEFPEYETKKGKRKRKALVGKLYAGHDSLGGIIDVAMITSFGKRDNIDERIKDYGLVIVDECHHAGAQTHEDVIKEINAKYVYGLTATPKREDGHEQKVYMQFGPIRYRLTAKDRAKMQGFEHFVIPRFTSMVNATGTEWGINEAYRELITNDRRNKLIIKDIAECVKNGRTPLVLTKFKGHADILVKMLENKVCHVFLLQGGRSNQERDEILHKLRSVPSEESLALVAIGKYIGEGFNYPRLDTMMLAVPIAWQGNVEQYAGRLHRDYEGKTDVFIYDYVDSHIKVLERMYYKRLRAYKKIGYEITLKFCYGRQEANAIFDAQTYGEAYKTDLSQANSGIVISSPGINSAKVRQLIHTVSKKQTQGIKVSVITIPSAEYPDNRIEPTKRLIDELRQAGIYVKEASGIHEHFAIIDKEIVWYGSMNMLSGEKEEDNLMRVNSKEIADELLEIGFGKT